MTNTRSALITFTFIWTLMIIVSNVSACGGVQQVAEKPPTRFQWIVSEDISTGWRAAILHDKLLDRCMLIVMGYGENWALTPYPCDH